MTESLQKLKEASNKLRERATEFPKTVIVLGSGLSGLLEEITVETTMRYEELPHMKRSTVMGHPGRFIFGKLRKTPVICMEGRLHYYEGYSMAEVVFPFRALGLAGAQTFILTNAAGGLHPGLAPADLVLIRDHINFMGANPLTGENFDELGPRFPDMSYVYDHDLAEIFLQVAKRFQIPLKEGVYVGLCGPSFETPAEIRMFRTMGGDVAGMSTVPEAIALGHMKKRVAAISCVTNLAAGVTVQRMDHVDVLETAKKVQKIFSKLFVEAIQAIGKRYG
ncbi:MAG: purine-nucleoside phosphorylase [Deltaproteobacteria bacterium]|nr:purine-nucleoside phosphorylase [Deltaproteobacteria bacterium]